jgi:hypothetical protein
MPSTILTTTWGGGDPQEAGSAWGQQSRDARKTATPRCRIDKWSAKRQRAIDRGAEGGVGSGRSMSSTMLGVKSANVWVGSRVRNRWGAKEQDGGKGTWPPKVWADWLVWSGLAGELAGWLANGAVDRRVEGAQCTHQLALAWVLLDCGS